MAPAPLSLAAALLLAFSPAALSQLPQQPGGLAAHHHSGQTFLTWTEEPAEAVSRYRVYRSDGPIDAASLGTATLLAEVWPGSSMFFADRYFQPNMFLWSPRYLARYVIADDGPELAADTGLLVWTVASEDFGGFGSGNGYYAVTSVDPLGVENTADLGGGNAIGPIAESVADPLPVRSKVLLGGLAEVYTQFVDLRSFNPTLSSPNAYNDWYGLDPMEPAVTNARNLGFTYVVFPPRSPCNAGGVVSGKHPVLLQLHGHGGERARPLNYDPAPAWCDTFRIYPIDPSNTWWFGHARNHNYQTGLAVPPGDTVENYTEARLLRMVYDLSRHPNHGALVDLDRVFVFGHSMGASGALALAMRYPDVFAAIHASQPMTNYLTAGQAGGTDWHPDVAVKFGPPALGLPVAFQAPADWAAHLAPHAGTSVWDWQNHQANLVARRADEMVPIGIDHGLLDLVLEWDTQGAPAYGAFDNSDRCWSGLVQNALHFASGIALMPGPLQKTVLGLPFSAFRAKRSEVVPGLARASNQPALPPTTEGSFHGSTTWSASWQPFDGAPVDQPQNLSLTLRHNGPTPITVDVTPRRLQAFEVEAGVPYLWRNERVQDSTLAGHGVVLADGDGLLTLTDFEVSQGGNRAKLNPALAADVSALSLASGGTQSLDLDAGPLRAGKLYAVLGSFSGTAPGITLDGITIPLVVDSYFLFTVGTPNSAVLPSSLGFLDGDGRATSGFVLPTGLSPGLAGLELHHAFAVLDVPGDQSLVFASNPVLVRIED